MTSMTAEQVPRRTAQGVRAARGEGTDLVVVDVRGPVGFGEHRVPGAISGPKDELDRLSEVLSPEQEIVFY